MGDKAERAQLRRELGKLLVDNMYIRRLNVGDDESRENEIDDLELQDDEDLEYELRMRDIMENTTSSDLSVKQKLLGTAHDIATLESPLSASARERGAGS